MSRVIITVRGMANTMTWAKAKGSVRVITRAWQRLGLG
jgi:hypothetical protein